MSESVSHRTLPVTIAATAAIIGGYLLSTHTRKPLIAGITAAVALRYFGTVSDHTGTTRLASSIGLLGIHLVDLGFFILAKKSYPGLVLATCWGLFRLHDAFKADAGTEAFACLCHLGGVCCAEYCIDQCTSRAVE